MFLRELQQPVSDLYGAGPVIARQLARLNILNIAGLLNYYPRDWEDRSVLRPLSDFASGQPVCTKVVVLAHDWFGFGRMKTLKVHIKDSSAQAVLVCFNRPFLEKQLRLGEEYWLWGNFSFKYGEIQSSAFELEPTESDRGFFGRILPLYPLSGNLNQGTLRRLMQEAVKLYVPYIEDEIPASLLDRYQLPAKSQAIADIHFPKNLAALDGAKRALIYEELFYLELMIGQRALNRRSHLRTSRRGAEPVNQILAKTAADQAAESAVKANAGFPLTDREAELSPLQKRLITRLPFRLTKGQLEALAELNRDLQGRYPMARLLQGDVGSGKTLVAFLACLRSIENGHQAVLMAPTELLARQHAENASRLLEPLGLRPAFLTANLKASGRKELLAALKIGEIDFVIGTHALFSKDVVYHSLGLVVIDEQHRFGVIQRAAIQAKGQFPDLLMMSATPIPRTLAHTVFGDLDLTYIREMPPGRKPVKTHLARQGNEAKVYDFIHRELAAGRQAYFIYPLIETAESKPLKDVESMAQYLANEVFRGYRVAVIHSRLDEESKRQTMEAFRRGDVQILTATSIVEVGVDVPNANCMVIEHAERFGLSALHQLRGRVGRGSDQAYCFLVYSNKLSDDGKARLKIMLENQDGFIIAEEDLKLRGPGQIVGLEQSGFLTLGIADPLRDVEVLLKAREDAFAILDTDSSFQKDEHHRIAAVFKRAAPYAELAR